jgi:two-component system NtrC family sensor kinase
MKPGTIQKENTFNNAVLCIDDDPGVLDTYRKVLMPDQDAMGDLLDLLDETAVPRQEAIYFSLSLASSGEQGLAILQEEQAKGRRFAVACVDMRMPGGWDGFETIKELRAADPNIFCCVITAYTDRSFAQIQELFAQDHQDELHYINKPFSAVELQQITLNMVFAWNWKRRKEANQYSLAKLVEQRTSEIREQNVTLDNIRRELEKKNTALEKAIADLKYSQTQILQQEKMATIGQLAAGVAHEINNPMGFITSNLGTLEKYVARFVEFIDVQTEALAVLDETDRVQEKRKKLKLDYVIEDTADLIQESLDGAKRVTEIVRNLKSFSRIDKARITMSDINECIETTLKIIWNELKYKTTVHKEYDDLPPTLCNPQALNHVFMNLLVNAAQAIDQQGEITIRTSNGEGFIRVVIADTGCGISDDQLNKIFEPFFTTKEAGQGTGLGLSICYDIIKKHEGEITVASEVGKGTTFTVSLPIKGKRE